MASGLKVKIDAPKNRRFTAWLGGRELAGHESLPDQCVYFEDYDEHGVNCVLDR